MSSAMQQNHHHDEDGAERQQQQKSDRRLAMKLQVEEAVRGAAGGDGLGEPTIGRADDDGLAVVGGEDENGGEDSKKMPAAVDAGEQP
jgi:hypothetical protein